MMMGRWPFRIELPWLRRPLTTFSSPIILDAHHHHCTAHVRFDAYEIMDKLIISSKKNC